MSDNIEALEVEVVYRMLKNRAIHPSGSFDGAQRWYADNQDLINVREPSRAHPYSQMSACRTLKYVKAVARKFKCKSKNELIASV